MIKRILLGLVLLLIALAVVVALQPADFRIERSAKMAAGPAAVLREVNDFHRWAAWSPWEHLDPAMQRTFEGAPAGVGAVYTWSGNSQAGKGRMEITDSRPELVRIKLDFLEPFKASDIAEFTLRPEGDQTAVTWSMSGTKNFMMKGAGLFMNLDKTVGGDFEKGLAQLKSVVETAPKQ